MNIYYPVLILSKVATRYPRACLLSTSSLALISLIFSFTQMRIEPDRNTLIRSGRDWNDRFESYRQNFEGTRDFIIVAQGGSPYRRENFIDELSGILQKDAAVASVMGKFDRQQLTHSQLMLMNESDLQKLHTELEKHQDILQEIAPDPSLETILAAIDRKMNEGLVRSMVSGFLKPSSEKAPQRNISTELNFLLQLLKDMEESLKARVPTQSPWANFLGLDRRDYLTTHNGTYHLLAVTPRTDHPLAMPDGKMFDRLTSHLNGLKHQFPNIIAGITGQRAINVSEMRTTIKDTRLAGIVALLGVSLIFIFGFSRSRHALMAVYALCIGIIWSAGALTLVVGHLTILSVAFTSILIGLGIDFGIHIIASFEDTAFSNDDPNKNIQQALELCTPGNVSSAVTTSLAFFGLGLCDFLGLAELGIIAGMGVLLCLLAQSVVLPSLLVLLGHRSQQRRKPPVRIFWQGIDRYPKTILFAVSAASLVGYAQAGIVNFDGNLLHLQARGTQAVQLEELLIGDRSGTFAVATSTSIEAARRLGNKFNALAEVSRVDSIAHFFPENVPERIHALQNLVPLLPKISNTSKSLDIKQLVLRLKKMRFKLRKEEPASGSSQKKLLEVRSTLQNILSRISTKERDYELLDQYQTIVRTSLSKNLSLLQQAAQNPEVPSLSDIPVSFTQRLVGKDGKFMLRLYPSEDVWEDEPRERFIQSLRSVDANVTGIPVQSYEAGKLMMNGYIRGGLYAAFVVVIILLIDLKSLLHTALALVPCALGCGLIILSLVIFNLSLNLANLIILPLTIGISIDIGIHLIHRFRRDNTSGFGIISSSTGHAVVLSCLTTMIGFGSLIVAQHQGIRSIGILLSLSVAASLIAAIGVLIPMLHLLYQSSLLAPGDDTRL